MRINDHVYFAPGILLKNLNIYERESLIDAFHVRVNKYYLQPIKILNKIRSAFSVGIIEFSMIDALARYSTNNNRVGDRIKEMIQVNFRTSREIAEKAHEDFRNGLLHENHIKNCGQFCYETSKSFELQANCLIINPLKLQRELDVYFEDYINSLRKNENMFRIFFENIKRDFEKEIDYFKNND